MTEEPKFHYVFSHPISGTLPTAQDMSEVATAFCKQLVRRGHLKVDFRPIGDSKDYKLIFELELA